MLGTLQRCFNMETVLKTPIDGQKNADKIQKEPLKIFYGDNYPILCALPPL
jgi:hypothetical protein